MEKRRSYGDLIERYRQAAEAAGACLHPIGEFSSVMGDYEMYTMHLMLGDGRRKICISTGMHGDEPAGPETLLRGLGEIHARRDRLNAEFFVFPCDNPTGWELDTRENYQGVDLNREFLKVGQAAEIAIVEAAIRELDLDFTLDLHEDVDTAGMYLDQRYRKGHPPLAGEMIEALRAAGHPIHEADWIEGLPASGGVIWPSGRLRKFELPKAVFLWHQGCKHLVTTESPGKLELERRVDMQMICFGLFLDALEEERL